MRTHYINWQFEKYGYIEYTPETQPDYRAVTSWTNMLEKADLSCDICFFGNSITRNSDFTKYYPDKTIINLGYSGDFLINMCYRVPQIKAVKPKKLFLMGGINDLYCCKSEEVINRYDRLLKIIRDTIPEVDVYIESVLPVNQQIMNPIIDQDEIIETNNGIKKLADKYNFIYIDLYALYQEDNMLPNRYTNDGIHLTSDAYRIWAEAINTYIYE